MALVLDAIVEVLRRPSVWSVVSELLLLVSPIWIAVLVGLLVGWAWKPKWAAGLVGGDEHEGSGPHRTLPRFDFWRPPPPPIPGLASSFASRRTASGVEEEEQIASSGSSSAAVAGAAQKLAVGGEDLVHLWRLVEERDGGPLWHQMMDKTLPSMSYKAWRRDTEDGPPQYRSRTIFEDATPEVVRDFFGDDEFRMKNKWDDMLICHNTLEECPTTGTMVVHWIRKFPFFCSDREYIIGRRIWESQGTYYCVTKGVPCSTVPRRNKPRRVDLYYSSWCIRAVESRRGDGQMTACEVLLFHYEDMGIPREIAKLGIRQGMWGCVSRIEPGLRAYQKARMNGEPLSPSALTAQINTKFNHELITSLEVNNNSDSSDIVEATEEKPWGGKIPKLLLLGGAVALACTIDQGLLTKAVIFGVARRFVRQRKGL